MNTTAQTADYGLPLPGELPAGAQAPARTTTLATTTVFKYWDAILVDASRPVRRVVLHRGTGFPR